MDSHALAAQTSETGHIEHAHPPHLRHHFETVEQQREAASFGMWLFLLTEIMFFGGLFCAYLIYRNWYYPAFVVGSHQLKIWAGTTNTGVLIGSSFTMAMAVYSSQVRNRAALIGYLLLTIVLGTVFLGIKGYEWHDEWEHHHVPGLNFSVSDFVHTSAAYPEDKPLPLDMAEKTQVYFSLYFAMTGMHALHMIIGVSLLIILLAQAWGGAYTDGHMTTIENFGLYWHFVDIIWIFLFPLLYLISRHQ
ncbi:cytochrome c oxidase subunit 3 [Paracidobacterium acidisoli]|uniref:Cytochrome c oxidase subunit 3 family protein n=1 Tax=Paracidobacterium acidisoli TaxID=2303751 RepID=A0A372INF4_9BACT|nr:cytochrome c oxidase subunit 3 [Paracidobacterium acidisoli]MBT9332178.1 cytochrome c oxidase subunit 3 [Paracidobacterium acidisoli]